MNENTDLLVEGCRSFGISLNRTQIEQFLEYYRLLTEWNQKINLTSITEFQDVVQKHFLDSLAAAKFFDMFHVKHVIDIGTGAGFPGVPLKIAFPHLQLTLLDSLNKRVLFLKQLIEELHLDQVEIIHGRAEEFARQDQYRDSYDLCVSRAVASLNVLSEYCLPYVSVHGHFIAYKSGHVNQELSDAKNAIRQLGASVENFQSFTLPGHDGNDLDRSLIIMKKDQESPEKFPRRAGIPARKPLL